MIPTTGCAPGWPSPPARSWSRWNTGWLRSTGSRRPFEDCYAAAEALYGGQLSLKGVRREQITVMGDSAGGNLAAASAPSWPRSRGRVCYRAPADPDLSRPEQLLYGSVPLPFGAGKRDGLSADGGEDGGLLEAVREQPEKDRENPYFAPLLAKDLARICRRR